MWNKISNKNGHKTAFEPPGVMHCSLWKTLRKNSVEFISASKERTELRKILLQDI